MTPIARTLVVFTITTLCLAGAASARAHHVFQATHVPPPVAIEGRGTTLHVPVASSCVAFCGWITATAHLVTSYGEEMGRFPAEVPYQSAAVIAIPIPGKHVQRQASSYFPHPFLHYWIEVTQQDCAGDCHVETVRLPASGSYAVPLVWEP